MGNLSNLFISASFQSLIHLGNDSVISSSLVGLQDGFGNSIGVAVNSAGDLSISGSLTASLQQGYVWVGNSNGKTTTVPTSSFGGGGSATWPVSGTPSGIVSGSSQLTSSYDQRYTLSGSINLTPLNQFTASQQILNAQFATTGSNTFNGNQNIVGAVTASTAMIAGLHYPTVDNGIYSFLQTDGAGNLSFQYVNSILEEVRYGENITIGDPLYVSGSNGTRPVVWRAQAANTNKMPVIYIATSTAVANTNTTAITLGLITGVTTTGYPVGTTVYVGEAGGWTSTRPSGSNSIVQPLGIVTKEGSGGSGRGLVLNPGPAFLPNLQTGYAWVGNGGNQPAAVATSSFSGGGGTINTGSFATTGSNSFIGDQTITGSVNISGGEHLYIKRAIVGAQQELRLGSTDNGNNFAFIVTGSDQNPGQQVWGINVGGSTWANSFDAGVVFNSYVSSSNSIQVGRGSDDGAGRNAINISRLSGQTGIQINQTGVGASWFVGTRENNNGNLIISSSANDRYIEFASSSGWMEVYANQTNFNNNVAFRNRVDVRNVFTDTGLGYTAQFDTISGSNANISGVMNLKPQNPLPTGKIGDLAVSGSNLYFYNGSWTQVI